MGKTFCDTNVLLYLLSTDPTKAESAQAAVETSSHISVQVLNEFAAAATRKLGMTWREVREVLATVRAICAVEPLTAETHDRAVALVERYQWHIYDALIVASALLAGCERLYSEDLQAGQRVEKQLRIVNPF